MKKTIVVIIIVLVLTATILTLGACQNKVDDKTLVVDYLGKATESTSATVKKTIEKDDVLLSESVIVYSKGQSDWTYTQTDKKLKEDPFATEKYETTTSNGSIKNAPAFAIRANIIDRVIVKNETDKQEYDVFIKADELQSFMGLSDSEFALVSNFELEVDVVNGRAVELDMSYDYDGTEVSLEIKYTY